MDLARSVVHAYDAARACGRSRADAFIRAIDVYLARHPDLLIDDAGREVARILLHAAATAAPDQTGFGRTA